MRIFKINMFHVLALSWIPLLIIFLWYGADAPMYDPETSERIDILNDKIDQLADASVDLAKETRQNLIEIERIKYQVGKKYDQEKR